MEQQGQQETPGHSSDRQGTLPSLSKQVSSSPTAGGPTQLRGAHCQVRPQGAKRLHICRGWHAILAGICEVHPRHNVPRMQQQALQVVPAEVGVAEEDYSVN